MTGVQTCALPISGRPENAPLVGVLVDETAPGMPPEEIAKAGYMALRLGKEPRRFSDAAAWTAGVVCAMRKGNGGSDGIEYGRRYEDLVHALPDIVYELDVDGVITFINDSVSLLGYAPSDLIGKHYSVILHDDDAAIVDRDRVLPEFAGYRTGLALSPKLFNERRGIDRRTTDLEVRLRKKPGFAGALHEVIGSVISYGEVSSVGEYARGDQGEFKGSVGIIRDVTMRRKSEEMLRKLYQAVDQLGACVFVLNHVFEVEYVNPAFFMLTGFAPPDVIGQSIFRFFAFMPVNVERISKHIHDGFETRQEVLVPRAEGGQFWADFSMSPVRNPSGAITHAIVIVEDISSRKSMEELLRKARLDAEEANRSKTRLLSTLAGELRNPLGGIMLAARRLGSEGDDVEAKAASILGDAQKVFDAVSGVLDYVRSERPDGQLKRSTFELAPFMERTCSRFRDEAQAKGLPFELEAEAGETIEADIDRLGRVVELLAGNVVKNATGGSVSISARMDRQGGNVPHLVVTAIGAATIAAAAPESDFPRNDQARQNLRKSGEAWLDLAKRIVMVLGGELRHDAAPDGADSYTVVVPAAAPVKDRGTFPARYTVLVVDDNVVNLEYMRTLIENSGHRVHCASGAAEAFRVLESRYVDAALLDIQMPGVSGTELAGAIRGYTGGRYSPRMPLFAMTAQDRDGVERADELFLHVFSKPTDIAKFSSALCSAMEARESASKAAIDVPGGNREDAVSRVKLDAEAAISALSIAIGGTIDARIDIRAEASQLASLFKRLSCAAGQEMATLFIEHYAEEDKAVLSGLLTRMGTIMAKALFSLESKKENRG